MHLIKSCPSCGKKLRFPLDKGKIRVNCPCGYSFIADPDNPELFKNSSFDLGSKPGPKQQGAIDRILGALENIDLRKLRESAIRGLYDFRYRVQNFSLLPTSEKIKLVAIVAVIIAAAFIIAFLVNSIRKPDLGDGNII